MPSLGLIMIVRNEQANLPLSLGPVAGFFDQVVVVDSGSEDNTVKLAQGMGAQVHRINWRDDFSYARNISIQQAKTDWLLWLDADNRIEDINSLQQLRQMLPNSPAILWGLEKISHSGELLWQKRVFPRLPEVYFRGLVHEQLVHPPHWPNLRSSLVIEHWGYEDPAKVQQKGHYYLGLLQKTLERDPHDYYARFQAARCYFNLRDFASAHSQLKQAANEPAMLAENPELALHVGIMLATVLERLQNPTEALALLQQLSGQYPDSALAAFAAGKLAYSLAEYDLAGRMLQQSLILDIGAPVIDLNPHKVRFSAYYLLGLAQKRMGDDTVARKSLEQALQIDPEHRGVRLDLAEMLWSSDNKTSALAHLHKVLNQYPQDGRARRLARKWEEHA